MAYRRARKTNICEKNAFDGNLCRLFFYLSYHYPIFTGYLVYRYNAKGENAYPLNAEQADIIKLYPLKLTK